MSKGRDIPRESSSVSKGAACDSNASMSKLNDKSSNGTKEFGVKIEEASVLVDYLNRRLSSSINRNVPRESSGVSEGVAYDSNASISKLNDKSSNGTKEFSVRIEEASILVDRLNRRLSSSVETGISRAEVDSIGVSIGRFAYRRRLTSTRVIGS